MLSSLLITQKSIISQSLKHSVFLSPLPLLSFYHCQIYKFIKIITYHSDYFILSIKSLLVSFLFLLNQFCNILTDTHFFLGSISTSKFPLIFQSICSKCSVSLTLLLSFFLECMSLIPALMSSCESYIHLQGLFQMPHILFPHCSSSTGFLVFLLCSVLELLVSF